MMSLVCDALLAGNQPSVYGSLCIVSQSRHQHHSVVVVVIVRALLSSLPTDNTKLKRYASSCLDLSCPGGMQRFCYYNTKFHVDWRRMQQYVASEYSFGQ